MLNVLYHLGISFGLYALFFVIFSFDSDNQMIKLHSIILGVALVLLVNIYKLVGSNSIMLWGSFGVVFGIAASLVIKLLGDRLNAN